MQLFGRNRQLNTDAFMDLIESEIQSMYKTAWAILKNEEDAADAIQEAIVKGFENLGSLREPKYFKTWIIRILMNTCFQIRKQRQREFTYGDNLPVVPVEETYDKDLGFKELLNMVSDEESLLLTLHYADGFKLSEIAELLDMNVNTVKTQISRARAKIRRGLLLKQQQLRQLWLHSPVYAQPVLCWQDIFQ